MLTRLDKDGKRISEKNKDILELENDLNLAIVQAVRDTQGYNHLEPEEDEEEKEMEKAEIEQRKRKTTFSNLKKRAITGFNKDQKEIMYISRRTFMRAGAVFAELPPIDKMIELNKKNQEKNNLKRKKSNLSSAGFKLVTNEEYNDINDLHDELEDIGIELNPRRDNEVKEIKEEVEGEEEGLNQTVETLGNSEAYGDLKETLIKPNQEEDRSRKMTAIEAQRKEIIDYIINNRDVLNDGVRSAEISSILYRNMTLLPFSSLNLYRKILAILNFPINLLTYLTVLPTTEEGYTKIRYILNPFFGMMFTYFMITYLKIYKIYLLAVVALLGLCFSALLGFVLVGDKAPTGKLKEFFMFLGFITSFFWMFFLSDVLVSVIETLNVLFNYQYTFMMVSSFSFWNWVPMVLGSLRIVALMKEMPSFSGILFNSFFVFGIAVVVQALLYGNDHYSLEVVMWPVVKTATGFNLFLALFMCFVVFSSIFISVFFFGLRYRAFVGFLLAMGYVVYVIFVFVRGISAPE